MEERIHLGEAVTRLGLLLARITVMGVGGGYALAWVSAFIQSFRI